MTEGRDAEQAKQSEDFRVPATDEAPSPSQGAPAIDDEDQRKGQTQHPAPNDDVGVPEDSGDGES
jgi:hypothetical protein